jgi:hypothetical protein
MYREQNKNKVSMDFAFSAEEENKIGPGQRRITVLDENGADIGFVIFDYTVEPGGEKFIKMRNILLEEYNGNDLGVKLYQKVIDLAREKKLDGLQSDCAIRATALATWKKLFDLGYDIKVNPDAKEEWEKFLKAYNNGLKYKSEGYGNSISLPDDGSIFELRLPKSEENPND